MKPILLILTFITAVVLSGCENNDLMLSEKKLNSKIQKTWRYIGSSPNADAREKWTFQGGTVALNIKDSITYMGAYQIDARFSKAYVNLSNFSFTGSTGSHFTAEDLNRQWTIVELEGGVMYLSGTDSRGAIRSLEFIEQ